MLNASNIKIAVDMAVADSGATGHFVIVGTNVSDMKISGKPSPVTSQTSPNLNKRTHVRLMSQVSLKKPDGSA